MRHSALLPSLVLLILNACSAGPPPPPAHAVTTLREMMLKLIQPSSDAVFYVSRNPPQNDEQWQELEEKTLLLAESANLLMLPGYARDQQAWMMQSAAMRTAARKAYEGARQKRLEVLEELNSELYDTCESCHTAFR